MSDSNRIDLEKKVYSKTEYPKVIDTKFSQLGVTTINDQIDNTFTTEEFFNKYNELFYSIPALGDTNSHQYLIETSTEYIGFEANQLEIEALIAEITQLRKDLLQAQIEKAEALTGQKIDLDINDIEGTQLADSKQFSDILESIDSQPKSPTEVNTTSTANNASTSNSSGGSSGGAY